MSSALSTSRAIIAAVAFVFSLPSHATAQPVAPSTIVAQLWSFPPSSPQTTGMGFTVASVQGGCRMLSASHTFRQDSSETRFIFPGRTQEMNWSIEDRGRAAQDFAISPETTMNWFGPPCPKLPRAETVDQILSERRDNGSGVIATITASNTQSNVFVRVVAWSPQTIIIRGATSEDQLLAGMSGAPLIVNGRVVGMFVAVKPDGTGEVLRFEGAPGAIRTKIAFDGDIRPDASQNAVPYDPSSLPEAARSVVLEARRIKEIAEQTATQSDREYGLADTAAKEASGLPLDTPLNGYARFSSSNGNFYSGQVYVSNISLFGRISFGSDGYGVSEVRTGEHIGQKYYCQFERDKGCAGLGRIEYAINSWNIAGWQRWRGQIDESIQKGFGQLLFRNGDSVYAKRTYDARGKLQSSAAVWERADGTRFEGRIGSNWELGVLWNADGTWKCIGYWTAQGLPDTARNQAEGMSGCR